MTPKYTALERQDGHVDIYESGVFIGTINLGDFPFAGFRRLMEAANKELEAE